MKDLRFTTVGWPFGEGCWMFLYPVAHRNPRRTELPQVLLGLASIRRDGLVLPPGANGCLWDELDGLTDTTGLTLKVNYDARDWRGVVENSKGIGQ